MTDSLTVVLLDGAENAVACARSLLAEGTRVVTVGADTSPAHHVRGVVAERTGPTSTVADLEAWCETRGPTFKDAVLLPLSDTALLTLCARSEELAAIFRLPAFEPNLVRSLLDKERTLELAHAAGVKAPRIYTVDEIGSNASAIDYPLLVKPRHTFELLRRRGVKFLWANNPEEALEHMVLARELPGGAVFMEFVPGSDEQLCSYYEYRVGGRPLVSLTKRIIRRFPANQGGATCHELIDLPDVAAAGKRFFDSVGLVGMGNVEFKRDPRSGELKLIECNCRMTAAAPQIQAAGIDLVGVVVDHAAGRTVRAPGRGRNTWYWYPVRDLRSTLAQAAYHPADWARVALRRPILPYWSIRDPGPTIRNGRNAVRSFLANRR